MLTIGKPLVADRQMVLDAIKGCNLARDNLGTKYESLGLGYTCDAGDTWVWRTDALKEKSDVDLVKIYVEIRGIR